ncbi:MAG: hypothetical protein D6730_22925 [Bacteroidetes bacterium]|nr:MAG: hypothetical protein D6730_22925 [Bacteroidota bacterium]
MSKYTHFIKLTPLEQFCFGGESFASKEEKVFYFQRSREFPQQTSLLGLLRYQLLLQNGMLEFRNGRETLRRQSNGKAGLLVGSRGFDPLPEYCPANFGVISQLSPVFITHKSHRHLLPFPGVKAWAEKNMQNHQPVFELSRQGKACLMGDVTLADARPLSLLHHYSPKLGFEHGFRDSDSGEFVCHKEVFVENMEPQIGIFKAHTLDHRRKAGSPEQEGFFKIQYQRLQPGYAFGLYVQLSDSASFSSQPMVMFGKERSPFQMEVQELKTDERTPFERPLPELKAGDYLWLASSARLNPQQLYAFCEAVLTEEESFRCMVSELSETCNYYGRPEKRSGMQQPNGKLLLSQRYNLMKRGSVLKLTSSLSEAQRKLLSDPAFQLIGYNHFLTVKPQ